MGNKSGKRWPEVSKERPCPICGHDRRCKLAEDGLAAVCFRPTENNPCGWRIKSRGSDSVTYMHENQQNNGRRKTSSRKAAPAVVLSSSTGDKSGSAQVAIAEPAPLIEPAEPTAFTEPEEAADDARSASVDDCDRVYRELLDRLSLSDEHRQSLRNRGFSDEAIDNRGYKTKPAGKCLLQCAAILRHTPGIDQKTFNAVPGLRQGTSLGMTEASGILIPVRAAGGKIAALRLRRDDPGDGGKYRWITSRVGDQDGP